MTQSLRGRGEPGPSCLIRRTRPGSGNCLDPSRAVLSTDTFLPLEPGGVRVQCVAHCEPNRPVRDQEADDQAER